MPETNPTNADLTEGASAAANATNRRKIITDTIREIIELEGQRKDISDEIRELKTIRIKGHLGMKISDFNAALRLYKLEGDDRTEFLSTLRETFEALGLGEQLDWLANSASADDLLRRKAAEEEAQPDGGDEFFDAEAERKATEEAERQAEIAKREAAEAAGGDYFPDDTAETAKDAA